MLNKFATGLVTGGIIAAMGISYLMTEPKTRKRVAKESKRAMRRAGDYISECFH
jgi:hypothetical protein